ncbi:MAG TPA: adenylate/guanylate cyclase domain-containing protein, partial [bacterium]|nr:adenylate/guanylate cyclase domain-containing protein [bacterium]
MIIAWLERNWTQRRSRTGILLSLVVALAVFWLQYWGWLELAELKTLDWRYRNFRSQEHLRSDIVILDIDEKSIKAMEETHGRFPWPRNVHAEMITYLQQICGAKAIAFDVLFAEPTQNPTATCPQDGYQFPLYSAMTNPDYQLAEMTALTGRIHYAAQFSEECLLTKVDSAVIAVKPFAVPATVPTHGLCFPAYPQASTPLLQLANQAAGVGAINVSPDSDGPVRRSYTFIKYNELFCPSLSISVLRALASTPDHPATIRFSPGCVHIENPDYVDETGAAKPLAYRIPVANDGRMNIHYYGGMETYKYYSYVNVYMSASEFIPIKEFRDKIVLVGSTAADLMDLRATPFSSTYAGVETHANMINNILEQDFLVNEPRWLLLVVLLALAGIMGLWVTRHRALEGGLLTLLAGAALMMLVITAFERLNLAMSLVAPLVFLGTDYIVLTGAGYMVEERKRRAVTGAFSQYVNPEVVKEILKDPEKLKLGGDKREITIYFSDLAGFTTISETLDSAVLVPLLNEYLTAMSDIVLKYDGTVDKFIGDAVMAFWNAPLSQPDHAKRACWAALDQQAKLDELRIKWRAEGYPEMNARAGINTGVVVVGNMGSRTLKNYTVIGDTINLGARLEPANKPYGTRLMISEFTYAQAKAFIEVRRLDAIQVK